MSTELIKILRDKTSAGMMDCKKALVETDNDIDKAVEWLRKKGLSAAAKKSARVTSEGLVAGRISADKKIGTLVEVNSETDFVALNDKFQNLVSSIAHLAVGSNDVENLKNSKFGPSSTVAEEIMQTIATIGENITLRRVHSLSVTNGVVGCYIHNKVVEGAGKIATLVALESDGDKEVLEKLAHNIAMHITALNSLYLKRSDIPSAILEKEQEVFSEQVKALGKPQEVMSNIVKGKLEGFYKQNVLLEQPYIKDNSISIQDLIAQTSKEIGSNIEIKSFVKYVLGEGIELEKNDFAAEVEKMIQ